MVASVAGALMTPGMRVSRAGSIVERGKDSAKDKINYLREAGVPVGERPDA